MKRIYKEILKKALPYYKKGRKGDVKHIQWLFETIPRFINESDVDFDILMPVVILHDVGYSKVPKGSNPLDLNIRKLHPEKGAEIAEKILRKLNYSTKKIKEIKRLILKHDDWAFGDSFADEPILRIFNNFDFIWVASKEGFIVYQKILGKNPEETYKTIEKDQEANERRGGKWFNKKIEEFYNRLMLELKKEIFKR